MGGGGRSKFDSRYEKGPPVKLTRRRWVAGTAGWSMAGGLSRGDAAPGLFAWGGQANASDATDGGPSEERVDGLETLGP